MSRNGRGHSGADSSETKDHQVKERSDAVLNDVNTMVNMLEQSIERASLCVTTPDLDTLIKKYQGPILSRREKLHTFELLALANVVGRAALENQNKPAAQIRPKPSARSATVSKKQTKRKT